MRNKRPADFIADITYLEADDDVPAPIRAAATSALTAYNIAIAIASECRTDQITAAADLDRVQMRIANELADDLIAGKQIAIDKSSDQITKLRHKLEQANAIYNLAQRVTVAAQHKCGGLITSNRRDLILWCARKRANDLTRCGVILPDPVSRIWQSLDVKFAPKYDTSLVLDLWQINGQLSGLPIEWDQTWAEPARASLAWIYNQIALDNFAIQTNGNDHRIHLTHTVTELPQVPRSIPSTMRKYGVW